jgi:hypothetical protein
MDTYPFEKYLENTFPNVRSTFQNRRLGAEAFYPKSMLPIVSAQTKILEGRTNISERVFKALFTYVSTPFGRLNIKKCFENTVQTVCLAFQNLRFGEHKIKY